MGTASAPTLVWHAWRGRWLSVAREWHPALDVAEVERVLVDSFTVEPGAQWRAQADGSWIYTVRRVRAVGRTPGSTMQSLDSWLTRMARHEQV